MNTQQAPFPDDLAEMVVGLQYRPGWQFWLGHMDRGQGSIGLTFDVVTLGYNSYHPDLGESYSVHHLMPVPPAAYNRVSWRRWLLDMCILVDRHEACEFFAIDGVKPYAPNHGPGFDPYIVFELTTDEDRRTSFRGIVKESDGE